MIKEKIFEIEKYIVTIIVSMLIVFSFAMIMEVNLLYKSEEQVVKNELATKMFNEFYTIDELEKRIVQNPNDYMAHIKLAQKYNQLKEYNSANVYFKTALKISQRSNYSLYSYSLFCIERKLYNLALDLAEEISMNNKKAIKYKANIYENIADMFSKDGQIEASIKAYQVAYKYYKSIYPAASLAELKDKYADEYLKLADVKIKRNDIKGAELDIKNSLKIKETPLAKYKLALIYKDTDKIKAEKLMLEVLNENPYLVNPFIYNSILNEIIEDAQSNGVSHIINHYTNKLKIFNKKLSQIYVFKDDIRILNIKIIEKKNLSLFSKGYFLNFKIKNDSMTDIEKLYVLAEVYWGNQKFEIEKKVVTMASPLKKGTTNSDIELKLPHVFNKDVISLNKNLIVKLYVKKQKKAPWMLVKIQQLK